MRRWVRNFKRKEVVSMTLKYGTLPVILSFCHPPIFIPWRDVVRIERRSRWFGSAYRLVLRRAPELDFALRPTTFDAVRSDARAAGVAGDY